MSIGASSYVLPSRRAEQQEAVYHLLDDDDDLVLAHFTTKSTTLPVASYCRRVQSLSIAPPFFGSGEESLVCGWLHQITAPLFPHFLGEHRQEGA